MNRPGTRRTREAKLCEGLDMIPISATSLFRPDNDLTGSFSSND